MMATTNYKLPVFAADQNVDLIGVYNTAMNTIDAELKKINDSLATINSTVSSLQSTVSQISSNVPTKGASDEIFSVSGLSAAKITSNGFVYFEEQ